MSGGGDSEQTTETRINPALAAASQTALSGAEGLFNQGTAGIYQGTQLAGQDPLIQQAQNQQLALAAQGGDLSNMVGQQQGAFSNLLGAGDLENSLFQRQLNEAVSNANLQFERGSVPLFQQATAAGQLGGSEGQEGLGLLGGEVNRNMQNTILQAALGGQQTALQAQQLAPQSIGLGLLPSNIQQQVGGQRQARSQAELLDEIQQFNAPRQAELQNQAQFQNFLASNPLIGESTTVGTVEGGGNQLGSNIGAVLGGVGGFMVGGPEGAALGAGLGGQIGGSV